jgi:hypothetical protein
MSYCQNLFVIKASYLNRQQTSQRERGRRRTNAEITHADLQPASEHLPFRKSALDTKFGTRPRREANSQTKASFATEIAWLCKPKGVREPSGVVGRLDRFRQKFSRGLGVEPNKVRR